MKLLVVTHNLPLPRWGAGTRNYHLLNALARAHEVSLFATVDRLPDPDDVALLRTAARDIFTCVLPAGRNKRVRQMGALLRGRSYELTTYAPRYVRAAFAQVVREGRFDAVLFESAVVAGHDLPPGVLRIVDEHNVEHEVLRRTFQSDAGQLRRLYNRLEYHNLRAGELARCARADLILATSERDADALRALLPGRPVCVVPNGVDTAAFGAASAGPEADEGETPSRVVFTGTLGYYPNVQAVLTFAAHCWPRIRAAVPGATWQIVGSYPPPEVLRLAELPGVTVTGAVPAVQPYLASAAVAVAPLLIGGGTRLKILEAFAMGRAVVTTSVGCEGLAVEDGRHLLVADDPDAFADAVIALLGDAERRAALGAAGRALVEDRYTWERCGATLLRALDTLDSLYSLDTRKELTDGAHAGAPLAAARR